jgi:hypothetical protein
VGARAGPVLLPANAGAVARVALGEAVDPDDLLWLGGYQVGPEYRAVRKMQEQFGGEMSL